MRISCITVESTSARIRHWWQTIETIACKTSLTKQCIYLFIEASYKNMNEGFLTESW